MNMYVSVIEIGTGRVVELEPADPFVFWLDLVDRSKEHVVDAVRERVVARDPAAARRGEGRERLHVRVVAADENRARQLVEERRLAWLGWRWRQIVPPPAGQASRSHEPRATDGSSN